VHNVDPRYSFTVEKLKPIRRKMKELLQTPDEIIEVFKALIFAKDDMQPLIDGSTNKMVSFANALRIILHSTFTLATN
jgi:hypothetical protein